MSVIELQNVSKKFTRHAGQMLLRVAAEKNMAYDEFIFSV